MFGEDVSGADVLRLALDGHLKISVYFVNRTAAKIGRLVSYDDAAKRNMVIPGLDGAEIEIPCGISVREEGYLKLEEKVVQIEGVWDLPMIGGERIEIEKIYHEQIGGPDVELSCIDGTYVERTDGIICQLQQKFSAKFLETLKNITKHEDKYFPAGGLPDDCLLVIRTDVLREFENYASSFDQSSTSEVTKKENAKANTSLLKMVITMAVYGYKYDPKAKKSHVPADIVSDAELLNLTIDSDTVRKWLKEAAELLDQQI